MPLSMNPRFSLGIDLGTSNCAMAVADNDSDSTHVLPVTQIVAANRVGENWTLPSALYLPHPEEFTAGSFRLPWDAAGPDTVGQFARVVIEERPVDFYVTHLYMSRGDDSLRLFQVQQLLQWIDSRADGTPVIVCGDFNATLDTSSAGLMATRFRPTQTMPTAFTPLADRNGAVSHPDRPRMDRCIDYIWISDGIEVLASEVCFNRPSPDDPSLWPSDHAGVWADLRI